MAAAQAKPIKSVPPEPPREAKPEPVLRCIWFPGKTSVPTTQGMLNSKIDIVPNGGITASVDGNSVSIVRMVNGIRQTIVVSLESVLLEYHG